jgi:adenylate cyclase
VEIGVGIAYGPVSIATLGGEGQIELSAAGDTVNLASRLESLTRQHDAGMAVSDAVVAAVRAAGREELLREFRELPPQEVRGRAGKVVVWVLPRLPEPAVSAPAG